MEIRAEDLKVGMRIALKLYRSSKFCPWPYSDYDKYSLLIEKYYLVTKIGKHSLDLIPIAPEHNEIRYPESHRMTSLQDCFLILAG